jgi:hypothetical protein
MTAPPTNRGNANGLLYIQLESINAYTNAHKLALDGVDMFTWGARGLRRPTAILPPGGRIIQMPFVYFV